MVATIGTASLRAKQVIESVDVDGISAAGSKVMHDLTRELIRNGGDPTKISPALLEKIEAATGNFCEMRKQLAAWVDSEFRIYLDLFDLLSDHLVQGPDVYETAIGKVANKLSDVFEPC